VAEPDRSEAGPDRSEAGPDRSEAGRPDESPDGLDPVPARLKAV
jgi:hypothetical protein